MKKSLGNTMKSMLAFAVAAALLAGCTSGSPTSAPSATGGTTLSPQISGGTPPSITSPAASQSTPVSASASASTAAPQTPSASSAAAAPKASLSSASKAAAASPNTPAAKAANNRADHVVFIVLENHSFSQVVGNSDAPYMQSLIKRGALFNDAHGVARPSQPNYLALFSGSTQGVKDNGCAKPFAAPSLGGELLKAGFTFAGYSEDLPSTGYTGCTSKGYARKHNPWVQFTDVPTALNKPFTEFPKDFSKLPTVSFVIPNHINGMHDGTIRQADDWLKKNIDAYVTWAETHNSMLILTWDEDDFKKENHIPVIVTGPMVKAGTYSENINHYHILKMIEEMYNLPLLGQSAKVPSITSMWNK